MSSWSKELEAFRLALEDDKTTARRIVLVLLQRFNISGVERNMALSRFERGLRGSNLSDVSAALDYLYGVLRDREMRKKNGLA